MKTAEIKVPVTIPMPRFQGNAIMLAGQKWGWEMIFSIGSEENFEPLIFGHKEEFEGFETKDEAIAEMKKIVKAVSEDLKNVLGANFEGFLDLNRNEKVADL